MWIDQKEKEDWDRCYLGEPRTPSQVIWWNKMKYGCLLSYAVLTVCVNRAIML
jgi:hypothetical protein